MPLVSWSFGGLSHVGGPSSASLGVRSDVNLGATVGVGRASRLGVVRKLDTFHQLQENSEVVSESEHGFFTSSLYLSKQVGIQGDS